jgi:hypothetical protein
LKQGYRSRRSPTHCRTIIESEGGAADYDLGVRRPLAGADIPCTILQEHKEVVLRHTRLVLYFISAECALWKG